MREPDITVRGTRHRNIEAALEHLPVSDEDYAISIGKTYLTVPKAEVERLREAGVPFTIHNDLERGDETAPGEKGPSATSVTHAVEIVDGLMTVLDEDGHGRDCHVLQTFEAAKKQLERWQETYAFDCDEAIIALAEFFKKETIGQEVARKLERIAKRLLKISTLSCRGMPDLDFHLIHVLEIRLVLRTAYEIGRASPN